MKQSKLSLRHCKAKKASQPEANRKPTQGPHMANSGPTLADMYKGDRSTRQSQGSCLKREGVGTTGGTLTPPLFDGLAVPVLLCSFGGLDPASTHGTTDRARVASLRRSRVPAVVSFFVVCCIPDHHKQQNRYQVPPYLVHQKGAVERPPLVYIPKFAQRSAT